MFFSTPNLCWIARLRSDGNCCHFGRTLFWMCWRCSGVSLLHTCARSCNSCRCASGSLCRRRLSSRTFCFSRGLRLLKSLFCGGVYDDGGRFGFAFGCPIMSARLGFELGGRFAPEFCRSFCVLRIFCRCCLLSRFCSSLRGCLGGCCLGWLCCLGGLLSCRFCA